MLNVKPGLKYDGILITTGADVFVNFEIATPPDIAMLYLLFICESVLSCE